MVADPMIVERRNLSFTGRYRFLALKLRFKPLVVLEIEECWEEAWYTMPGDDPQFSQKTSWRKATPIDLAHPKFRGLIDGGNAAH